MQDASPPARAQAIPIAILCVTLLCAPFLLLGDGGLPRVDRLEAELRQMRLENGRLESECRDMRRRVEAYRTSPAHVESIAREELGLVRPDEVVIVLPE